MGKELSEMSLEELWELFPIILKEYNQEYPMWYEEEKVKLFTRFNDRSIVRINHIGSTSVPGIISKPIIDILMEIRPECNVNDMTKQLSSMEWTLMNASEDPFFSHSYCKGYTKFGFADRVYHLHMRYVQDWGELYFRDYLIENPRISKEYVALKIQLKNRYEHDRDAYTEGKGSFINQYTEVAKVLYDGRYRIT